MHYQEIETKFRVEEAERKLNLAKNQRELEEHEMRMQIKLQQMSLEDEQIPEKLIDNLV